MILLTLDTSSVTAAAGLYRDGAPVAELFMNNGLTHSQTAVPMIEALFKLSRLSPNDLTDIAVTNGPGSFTGLRIGVSAALGMAASTGANCVGVSSLEAAARSAGRHDGIICALMDARRGEAYTAIFRNNLRLREDRAIPIIE